jgi:hypothetical protein
MRQYYKVAFFAFGILLPVPGAAQWTLSLPPPTQTAAYFGAEVTGREIAEESGKSKENSKKQSGQTPKNLDLMYAKLHFTRDATISDKALRKFFNTQSLTPKQRSFFQGYDTVLQKELGLSGLNAADVHASLALVLYSALTGDARKFNDATVRSVTYQMAWLLSHDAVFMNELSNNKRQEVSEATIILTLAFVQWQASIKEGDDAGKDALKRTAERDLVKLIGLPSTKGLILTENGFAIQAR